MMLQLSPSQVFSNMLTQGREHSLEQMYIERGEKDVKSTPWNPVVSKHRDFDVVFEKSMNVEFQLPGNTLFKSLPVTRTFKVIERSNTRLLMRVITKGRDQPY
jgi:hypothetical protein